MLCCQILLSSQQFKWINTIQIGPRAFFKIEDDVKFTDGSEIFVQDLNVSVNDLQRSELVVRLVHGEAEEEAGVALVHYAHIFVLNEVAHLLFPLEDHPRQLSDDFLLVFTVSGLIPLLKTQLPLSAEQKNEVNHSVCSVNNTASTYVGKTWSKICFLRALISHLKCFKYVLRSCINFIYSQFSLSSLPHFSPGALCWCVGCTASLLLQGCGEEATGSDLRIAATAKSRAERNYLSLWINLIINIRILNEELRSIISRTKC